MLVICFKDKFALQKIYPETQKIEHSFKPYDFLSDFDKKYNFKSRIRCEYHRATLECNILNHWEVGEQVPFIHALYQRLYPNLNTTGLLLGG